jgi:carboxyl-terminal processing protease
MDSLQDDALQEVVNNLDPHSIYIPATDVSEVNEDIIGNFQGIGVEFNIFSDTVHVLYVIPNGPSDKAGLRTGDKILKITRLFYCKQSVAQQGNKKIDQGQGGKQG